MSCQLLRPETAALTAEFNILSNQNKKVEKVVVLVVIVVVIDVMLSWIKLVKTTTYDDT